MFLYIFIMNNTYIYLQNIYFFIYFIKYLVNR